MKNTMHWLPLVSLGLAGCLEIEAHVPEVCIQQRNIALDPSQYLTGDVLDDLGLDPEALPDVDPEELPGDLDPDQLPADAGVPPRLASVLEEQRAVETSFEFSDTDELDFLTDGDIDAQARLRRVTLRSPGDDPQPFAFLSAISVQMRSTSGNAQLPELTWLNCTTETCDFSQQTISQPSTTDADLVSYIEEGPLEFTLQFAGRLPDLGWTVDAELCFQADAAHKVF